MISRMTRFVALAAPALLMAQVVLADAIKWEKSYDEALGLAKAEKKMVMIDFSTGWCGWCKKMDAETFQDKEVVELSKKFVCLKLNADNERQLVQKYGVRGYPTVIFTDAQGNVVGGGPGFRPPEAMKQEMRKLLSK